MRLGNLTLDEIEGLDESEIDPKQLSSAVDRLQLKFCRVVSQARERGEHRVFSPNISAVGWVADICSMSRTSAADRLCVGKQIESLPKVAEALRAGEIGYQPVAVICHLNEQLAEKGDKVVEEDWVDYARKFSVKELRDLAAITRHVVDQPDGSDVRHQWRAGSGRRCGTEDGNRRAEQAARSRRREDAAPAPS
jgi:hypothetical protein